MKFKTGDRVKVVESTWRMRHYAPVGTTGEVASAEERRDGPIYRVVFDEVVKSIKSDVCLGSQMIAEET